MTKPTDRPSAYEAGKSEARVTKRTWPMGGTLTTSNPPGNTIMQVIRAAKGDAIARHGDALTDSWSDWFPVTSDAA